MQDVTQILHLALSTEARPTNPLTGEMVYETDTHRVWVYTNTHAWIQDENAICVYLGSGMGVGEFDTRINETIGTVSKTIERADVEFGIEEVDDKLRISSMFYVDGVTRYTGYTLWRKPNTNKITTTQMWALYARHVRLIIMYNTDY